MKPKHPIQPDGIAEYIENGEKIILTGPEGRKIEVPFPLPQLYIQLKPSTLGGFGVFATKDFSTGETIELCRVLLVPKDQVPFGYALRDYTHDGYPDETGKPKGSTFFTGYAPLYNHSSNPNAGFADLRPLFLAGVIAQKEISEGEEILVSYGEEWFLARDVPIKEYPKK